VTGGHLVFEIRRPPGWPRVTAFKLTVRQGWATYGPQATHCNVLCGPRPSRVFRIFFNSCIKNKKIRRSL